MTRIPSTEKTDDLIYRFEIKRGTPLHDPKDPHLLVFEDFVGPSKYLHSMDVVILRDRQRANDVEFRSFEHARDPNMTYIKLKFLDSANQVTEHDYLVTVVLRYFV